MKNPVAKSLAILAATAILAVGHAAAAGKVIAPGEQAPDTRGRDHNRVLHVIDFSEAEFTLVNFWATWCEPCATELPALQEAHETLGPKGLRVVGVTYEQIDDEELGAYIDEMGLTYTIFRAGKMLKAGWVGVRGVLPNSYLIDNTGKVLRRYVGASEAQIEGMKSDLVAVFEGRPMGTMVYPDRRSIATVEDRRRQEAAEKARVEAEEAAKKAEDPERR